MKIARPTEADINEAFKLLRALKVLSEGYNPFCLQDNEENDPTWLYDNDKVSALDSVVELYDECNIEWLLIVLSTVINPSNQIIDQESDTLDLSPQFKQWAADSKRLEWLCQHGAVSFGVAYDDDGYVMEGKTALKEHIYISDSEQIGFGVDFRTAIDDAMNKAEAV